jgi:hypothetical protein
MAVRVPAVGAIALVGLFVYAFYRSWGGAWPRIGFTGALFLLVGAAWAGVERVPRWVVFATAGVAASMIPGALVSIDDLPETPWLYVPVYAGVFIAVALAVGAIGASARARQLIHSRSDPSPFRVVCAGIVGLACIAAAAVGAPILMGAMLSGSSVPDDVESSYVFASLVLAASVGTSVIAWIAGNAIVHGRRRVSFAPMRTEIGV